MGIKVIVTVRPMNVIDIHWRYVPSDPLDKKVFETLAIEEFVRLEELARSYQGVPYVNGPLDIPLMEKKEICFSMSLIFLNTDGAKKFINLVDKEYQTEQDS